MWAESPSPVTLRILSCGLYSLCYSRQPEALRRQREVPEQDSSTGSAEDGKDIYGKLTGPDTSFIVKGAAPADGQLTVQLHGLDLDVRIGNVLRRIPLPNTLRGAVISETKVQDGVLRVYFRMNNA